MAEAELIKESEKNKEIQTGGKAPVKEKKLLFYLLVSSLLTAGFVVLIFFAAQRFFGREFSFLFGDQEIQFVLADRMFWRHFLLGEGLDFSFQYSMGLPTGALYAVLEMSPFGILHAFIQDAELAAFLVFVLKMMAAAAAFCGFSVKTLRLNKNFSVFLSVAYALSSYSLHFYMNIHFLDVVYIAPLLMMALVHFVDTNRKAWLIIIYAFSFLNIFLTGYSLGLFSFVVFLALLYGRGIPKEQLRKKILSYVLCVITAILISMAVLLPAILFFRRHMPGGSSFSVTEAMHLWEFPISFLPARKALVFNTLPALYCGLPVVLLTVLFFADANNSLKKKVTALIPLLFLIICTFWHPAYVLMHGLDEPDSFAFRFSYLWVLYLMAVSALEIKNLTGKIKSRRVTFSFLGIAAVYFIVFALVQFLNLPSERPTMLQWGASFILFTVYFVLILQYREKKDSDKNAAKWPVFALLVLWLSEVVVSGCFSMQNLKLETDSLRSSINERKESEAVLSEIYDEIKDKEGDLFFRVDLPSEYSSNESMKLNMNGMGYFTSIENTRLREELFALGYQGRPQYVTGRGSTGFTRMVFDNKYTLEKNWKKSGREQYTVKEYPETLPIAFMVSGKIKRFKAVGYNPFANQNNLAKAMTGEEIIIYPECDLDGNFNGVEFYPEDDATYLELTLDSGGIGTVEFTTESDGESDYYIYLSQDDVYPSQYKGASLMPGEVGGDWAGVGYSLYIPGIVPMADNSEGLKAATLVLQREPGSFVFYQDAYCVKEDSASLHKAYEVLSPGKMVLTSFKENRIKGRVSATKELPVLYTSIPYDEGWHIKVDGEETECFGVMDKAFLACELTPGEHEIELYYRPAGRTFGLICTAMGLLILGIIVWKERKRNPDGIK